MKNIFAVLISASLTLSLKSFQVSRFCVQASTNDKKAPNAPASVGVTMPAYIPPIIPIIRAKSGQTWLDADNFSRRLYFSATTGASSGRSLHRIMIIVA